ncbi:MAG: competence/damage-inducible protein A [bacterium]|nr:competence/damage-inducible protein A [bacterium]
MKTELITIGDEVLMGQVVNTNASWLGETLTEAGVQIGWLTVIPDQRQPILQAFRRAKQRAGAVIITGGLGPTPDDLTKPCLVEFFQDDMVLRDDLLAKVQKRFSDRGLTMPEASRNQAEFPASASDIPNPNGTATGIHYSRDGKDWFSLPGVPMEMRYMVESYVLPKLIEKGHGSQVAVRIYRTAGIGESFLLESLTKLKEAQQLVEVAFLPKIFGVDLKLTARGDNQSSIAERLSQAEKLLLPDFGSHVYATDTETLPEATGKLARKRGFRIAVAESCTGGLIAKLFTDIPGSSDYFERGVVVYSNEAKTQLLGIPACMIDRYGAVSEKVAGAMAQGLLERCSADFAVSVTGIAGPGGGSPEKPVGLVFIGVADRSDVAVREFQFGSTREINRKRAAYSAIKLLYDRIKSLDS